jgi:cysteine desulfurase/selenocysteine lyase
MVCDGAQAAPHLKVDVQELGCDFVAISGHKMCGPSGIGVLWGRAEALQAMPPFLTGGGMVGEVSAEQTTFAPPPRRFEAGTPPIAAAIGLGAALSWMMDLPWPRIEAHEQALLDRLAQGLANFPGLRLLGPGATAARCPIISFDLPGLHPHDICQILDRHGVALRGGHLCAQPLMRHFSIDGATRASLAPYTTREDIDALLNGLGDAIRILR